MSINSATKQLLPRERLTEKAVDNTPLDISDLRESPELDIGRVLNVDVAEEGWHTRASHAATLSKGYHVHGGCSFAEKSNVILFFG
jgi:hypothetical protein